MARFIDLTGKKFGRLTVVSRAENIGKTVRWNCRCDCGNEKVVDGSHLKNGSCKSCGCLMRENTKKAIITHGMANTRIYTIWCGMKSRCYNNHSSRYLDYGGRGITICNEWLHDFQAFYDWAMANGYKEDLTIDRIDVNGNYEPSNCRWATRKEQGNNKRNNINITHNGETHTLAEWSEITGIAKGTLLERVKLGWKEENLLDDIIPNERYITYNGETKRVSEWSKITGLKKNCLLYRLDAGIPIEHIFDKSHRYPEPIEIDGEKHTIKEWSKILNIDYPTVMARIYRGWSVEDALTKPLKWKGRRKEKNN